MSNTDQQNAPAEQGTSVLHRKARAGVEEHRTKAMSLAKALRLTLARVADETLDMAMAALGVRSVICGAEDLEDKLAGDGLLLLLDGPARCRGGAIIDAELVSALIQQQTMGRVLPATSADPRRLTATDAAICAPFLDQILEKSALLPETETERAVLHGYRFGSHVPDLRLLLLPLQMAQYQVITLSIDISGGVRQGQIILCLPDVPGEPDHSPHPDGEAEQDLIKNRRTLEPVVMDLHVDLNISLTRLSMSLRELGKLKVDDLIDIGNPDFDDIRLMSMDGRAVGHGRLGQLNGQRAVEISKSPKTSVLQKRGADEMTDAGMTPHSEQMRDTAPPPPITDDPTEPDEETADLPEPSDLPDMSDLPGLPDMSDLPDLPDMSDLPDLPDLEEETSA